MKKIISALLVFISSHLVGQDNYWQQYLHYSIDAKLNDSEKSITGSEKIVYKNNSPQPITYIWFHIYPNAYKDTSTALFRQMESDPEMKGKLQNYTPGFISGLAFTVNGVDAKTEAHPNATYMDIIKVLLAQPLKPGDSVTIATPFKVQLPSYFSRSGFADGEFMATQWYPKPAVFDKDGWHEMPYINMGEFYSEYASYKVTLTVPSAYVVGATGVLQTKQESDAYKSVGSYNATHRDNSPKLYQPISAEPTKTLMYYADSVPDFAWFAQKDFVIEYDTVHLPSGRVIDAFTYYHQNQNTPWSKSIDYVKDAVLHYSNWVGEFEYPVVQAVEGTKNNTSGGMEYPMITLITSPDAKPTTLDAVIAHEVGHNWFMSMLGTNERERAWMDEGLDTYFMFRYEAEKYRSNLIFGDKIPEQLKKLSEDDFQSAVYKQLMTIPIDPALETSSANFKNSTEYFLTAYIKTAEWMYLLQQEVGKEKIDSAFHTYFKKWKFKHPQPSDIKASFEESLHTSVTKYFDMLNKKGKLVE